MNVIEHHPFEPFLPTNAKMLMLGSFPPAEKRWTMPFYYPNYINDMWRIFGIVFFHNKEYFVDVPNKTFKLDLLKQFLQQKGVALYDTATAVIRSTGTAADKDLVVVTPTDVAGLLRQIPQFFNITKTPQVGQFVTFTFEGRTLKLYRMPSSSRAYPMKIERKAEFYKPMLLELLNNNNPI